MELPTPKKGKTALSFAKNWPSAVLVTERMGKFGSPAEPVGASLLILTCQSEEHEGRKLCLKAQVRNGQQWHLGKTFLRDHIVTIVEENTKNVLIGFECCRLM